jgi:hypothetical protein
MAAFLYVKEPAGQDSRYKECKNARHDISDFNLIFRERSNIIDTFRPSLTQKLLALGALQLTVVTLIHKGRKVSEVCKAIL